MDHVPLATRIDRRVKAAVQAYCRAHGLKMKHFIEEALLDRLEEVGDVDDVRKIRGEPTRPLDDVLAELKLDDLL